MSWSIYARFYTKSKDNELKLVNEGYVDKLKSLSIRSYALSFDYISDIYDDLLKTTVIQDFSYEFYKELDIDTIKGHPDIFQYDQNENLWYSNKDFDFEPRIDSKDLVSVYKKDNYTETGNWYNIESFSRGLEHYIRKYEIEKENIYRLKELTKSIEYYKLTEEQQENLDTDIFEKENVISDLEDNINACYSIIHLMEFIEDQDYNKTCYVYLSIR